MKPAALLSFVVALPLFACTQPAGSQSVEPAPATAATPPEETGVVGAPSKARGIVIAKVQTHDAKVSILAGGGDLRVVVRKTDGTLVADGVTVDELRAKDPMLHAIVTSAVASSGTYLDASR